MENKITIKEITTFSEEAFQAVKDLVSQLDDQFQMLTEDDFKAIISGGHTQLFIAKGNANNEIVGMITLVVYRIPYKYKGWLEDLVVDNKWRHQGIGKLLLENALRAAKVKKIKTLDFTSRPMRESANRLYESLGFQKRDTNVYRIILS